MPNLQIDPVDGVDDLFCSYPTQGTVQPCHLSLSLDTGEMGCDYDPEVGGSSYPMEVHRRVVLWVPIPCLTANAANALMEAATPLAQRILADSAVEWDGNNDVGVMYGDAQVALQKLTELCDPQNGDWDELQLVVPMAADAWFETEGTAGVAARLRITAETTDAELGQLEEAEEASAAVIGPYGHTVLVGALAYLTQIRTDLAEAAGSPDA